MSPEQYRSSEVVAGLSAALFALIETLDRKGVVSFEDYRADLRRFWDEMPEEDAGSGTGFVFERLIDLLNEAVSRRKT